MREEGITRVRLKRTSRPSGKTDWKKLRALTDREVHAAALSDSDAPPLTAKQLREFRRVPDVKALRSKLGMTQEGFSRTFCLPFGTVRDWEQRRFPPDRAARTLLALIAYDPMFVRRALKKAGEVNLI